MNSKQKGKRGELQFASFLREHGFDARRGQQFSGSPDSPDVISSFPYYVEVKRVQKLNLIDACAQAEGDCGGKPWIVAHRRDHSPWLVTMKAEVLMELVRKTMESEKELSLTAYEEKLEQIEKHYHNLPAAPAPINPTSSHFADGFTYPPQWTEARVERYKAFIKDNPDPPVGEDYFAWYARLAQWMESAGFK